MHTHCCFVFVVYLWTAEYILLLCMCVYMCVQPCGSQMLTLNGFLNALHFIFETRALTKPGAHQPDQISWPVQWSSCLYPLSIWIIGKSHCSQFFPWVLGIQDQILIAKQALFLLSHVLSFCALDLTHTSNSSRTRSKSSVATCAQWLHTGQPSSGTSPQRIHTDHPTLESCVWP